MTKKRLPKWMKIELDLLMKLRQHFQNIFYQYPIAIRDDETGRIFIHKIDYVIRTDKEDIAIEYDGEYHYKSRRQRNKTEWRNKGIRKAGYRLIVIDGWEYQLNPEKGFEKLLKEIMNVSED